jgi:chemotaxis protein CheD
MMDATLGSRRVNIVQGEYHTTNDAEVVLTTILGSCVACCLHDPGARIGGMNHFLLPGNDTPGGYSAEHGVHAMELLVNDMLKRGARRDRLEAKLFGGARMLSGLTDVGTLNADFAERFVRREKINVTGGSLRGDRGRRIQFWPVAGRARQMIMGASDGEVFAAERARPVHTPDLGGGVELF